MKTLILGDVHGRTFWRDVIKNNSDKVERIIFLGDYFDPYYDEECEKESDLISMMYDIIDVKEKNPDKVTLLLGNHDLHYIWNNFTESTRYNKLHARDYLGVFQENIDKFKICEVIGDCIFSHAGFTSWWTNTLIDELKLSKEGNSFKVLANYLSNIPISEYTRDLQYSLGDVSIYRGGYFETGSCVWADVREHSSNKGIYQIFGHTRLKSKPIITTDWACLDCQKGFIINTDTYEITEC